MINKYSNQSIAFFFISVLGMFLVGCGTTNQQTQKVKKATVTEDQVKNEPGSTNIQSLLVRYVPGSQVSETSGSRIRVASIRGRGLILYVVDGSKTMPDSDGSLPGITVSDIVSIEVLKDPADMMIYTARQEYGAVVLVKTKGSVR